VDWVVEFGVGTVNALTGAFRGLFWPALFFAALALILRKRQVLADFRRVLPETLTNLQIVIFNVIVVAPLIGGLSYVLTQIFQNQGLTLIAPSVWEVLPQAGVAMIAIVIGDFTGYWRHRLEHSRLLWPAHAVHHSDTQMTWLSLERMHPINRLTTFVIDSSVLLALGVPTYAIVANNLFRHYYGFVIHSDLPWTYGPLGKIFVSPAMHRWHHAADVNAYNSNYAVVFALFDRLFGTYRVPGPCDAPLGVTDEIRPGLAGQLGYAFTKRAYVGQQVCR